MEDTLISFETAVLAKEKGFNIITNNYYQSSSPLSTPEDLSIVLRKNKFKVNYNIPSYAWQFLAPTQSLLAKWLREVHKIYVYLVRYSDLFSPSRWSIYIEINEEQKYINGHESYEEALELGLQSALKLI